MIAASDTKRKPAAMVDPDPPDPLRTYFMERRRALLTELAALEKLLGLQYERKSTVDKT